MSNSDKIKTLSGQNEIPISYLVAFVLGIIVLIITLISLCILALSMRRQFQRRLLLKAIHEQEDDTKISFIGSDQNYGVERHKTGFFRTDSPANNSLNTSEKDFEVIEI
ncbi:hypothetical protein GcM1_206028 [Golovinomyces cichoracearum]|uniref:Uncharacterized protein n=1 Tax=Golovinomyces cichoracearum TaxID=62708 RepID=A0A420IWT0_9PEZI|nr:hypothetical protein GcM1_206028 [Golovinomyces cichoracearum]